MSLNLRRQSTILPLTLRLEVLRQAVSPLPDSSPHIHIRPQEATLTGLVKLNNFLMGHGEPKCL